MGIGWTVLIMFEAAAGICAFGCGILSLRKDNKWCHLYAIFAMILGILSFGSIIGAIGAICGMRAFFEKTRKMGRTKTQEVTVDDLEKYHNLYEKGAISKEEYEEKKNSILGK